jgi:hypothetical protein
MGQGACAAPLWRYNGSVKGVSQKKPKEGEFELGGWKQSAGTFVHAFFGGGVGGRGGRSGGRDGGRGGGGGPGLGFGSESRHPFVI